MIRRLGSPGFHGIGGIGVADMGAACPGGAGLLNALIAYWPGNEANGNAQDAHTNALHLTDVNTVTSAGGLVYATARQYTALNTEYHTRAGDDALLSTGDVDFTLAAWCRFDTVTAARTLAGKWQVANREYRLVFSFTANRIRFDVSNDGAATVSAIANTFGAPAINTWYLLIGWHDSAANTINITVNNGGTDSQPHATGVFDSTSAFGIGWSDGGVHMDGRIGPTMFWKSAAGGGGVLSAAQRTALYNGGAGLTYAQFTT